MDRASRHTLGALGAIMWGLARSWVGLALLIAGVIGPAAAQKLAPLAFKPSEIEVVEGVARDRLFLSQADIEAFLQQSLTYQACADGTQCRPAQAAQTRNLTPAQRELEAAIEEQNRKDPKFGLRYGMEALRQLRQQHDMQNAFLAITSGRISEAELQRNSADATRKKMHVEAVYGYCGAAEELGLFPSEKMTLANGQFRSLCEALISLEVYAANELLVQKDCGPLDHKMVPFTRKFSDSRTSAYAACRRARDLDLALRYSSGYLRSFRDVARAEQEAQHVRDCRDGRLSGKDCSIYATLAEMKQTPVAAFYSQYLAEREKNVERRRTSLSRFAADRYER
jgi:hypothetical protein